MKSTQLDNDIQHWFIEHVPGDWFEGDAEVRADGDEILVVGTLADGTGVTAFREETRDARIDIAADAEGLFRRKVSWGVRSGGETHLFTHLNVPVMTRLRLPERKVLDTLVEGGVARSRSEALAWCVRLVGKHEAEWLDTLTEALTHVQKVRAEAPEVI